VLVAGGTIVLGIVMTIRSHDLSWLVLSLPFLFMLLIASRYAPTGYRLAVDGVHVERKAGEKVIAYRDIRAVDRMRRPVNGLSFGGSNGLFGRFGQFWNPRIGFYRLFLSNTDSVVWITTTRGLVGVSPDRPDEFVERLAARVQGPAS
jgi:hypothetical protein